MAPDFSNLPMLVAEALKIAFLSLDQQIALELKSGCLNSGSTALVVLHIDNYIFTANIGDSKAFVMGTDQAVSLSVPHTLVA